ncbi:MAG: hypothetical protein H6R00_2477 [Proteobacteria bacterium]|nr:hypothetical protein [Pseudomonadota bacterium]
MSVGQADVGSTVDLADDFAQTLFSESEADGRGALPSGHKPRTALMAMSKIVSLFP